MTESNKQMIEQLPKEWFERLFELADKSDEDFDKWYPFLRGFIDSIKGRTQSGDIAPINNKATSQELRDNSPDWEKEFWQIVEAKGVGSHINLPFALKTFISSLLEEQAEDLEIQHLKDLKLAIAEVIDEIPNERYFDAQGLKQQLKLKYL